MNFFPWMDGRWIEYEVNIIYDIFLEIEKILKIEERSGVSQRWLKEVVHGFLSKKFQVVSPSMLLCNFLILIE